MKKKQMNRTEIKKKKNPMLNEFDCFIVVI